MPSNDSVTYLGVVMAGGSGERFWPLSRRTRPKQLLPLTHPGETMLGEAVSRLVPLIPRNRIFVITNPALVASIRDSDVVLPDENVVAEPCRRNTAGALIYMAALFLARYGGDGSNLVLAVSTADHLIPDKDSFLMCFREAMRAAEKLDGLMTIGLAPSRPETGYGYIQATGAPVGGVSDEVDIHRVSSFHEKPNRERAEDFLASGDYYWNSGMFFWRISRFLSELRRVRPDLAEGADALRKALEAGDDAAASRAFERLEDISVDFALMEHARDVYMVRAEFTWEDVGSWPALQRTRPADERGNVLVGDPVVIDSHDCIVYNAAGADRIAVSVVGMEHVVVVVTGDAVLVVPKDRAQDVRHAVRELRARGADQV